MRETYGNPSSLHSMGLRAEQAMEHARTAILSALGEIDSATLLFTSGATESNNTAILGTAARYGKRRHKIVTTTVEHASVRAACDALEARGFQIVRVAPSEQFTAEFAAQIDAETCLASMMLVNNETGHILPVAETFAAVKRAFPDVITHCDAVQGFLKLPFRANDLHADLISISGHKLHAAKGIGALWHRKGVRIGSLLYGGEQEHGLRPGTEAVPLICGFGAAVAELHPTLAARRAHCADLRAYAIEHLTSIAGVQIQSPPDGSPFLLSCSVQGLRSETLLHFLAAHKIFVSSGSACSKGKQSGVLQQFGIPRDRADSTIRISFCAENTIAEVDALCDQILQAQTTLIHK